MSRDINLADLITSSYISTNGIRLHCVSAGEGELTILLHGFPEHWYSWRHQLPALAAHGRVVAPDLRGYNLSDKPLGVKNYDIDILTTDILGLMRDAGVEQANIIGHDWGGALAWWLAIYHPDRVKRLVIMNAPHPLAFQRVLRGFDQLLRSWYILFFQLPWLPELFMRGRDIRQSAAKIFRGTSTQPEAFTDEDIERMATAIDQPGALTAMINYYRAAFRRLLSDQTAPKLTVPTQIIWGEQDRFLVRRNTELDEWVADLRVDFVPSAGHWVQQEEPDIVNKLLIEFLFEQV